VGVHLDLVTTDAMPLNLGQPDLRLAGRADTTGVERQRKQCEAEGDPVRRRNRAVIAADLQDSRELQ